MSFRMTHYGSGVIYGIQYHFEKANDGIGLHKHLLEQDAHNTMVMRGSIMIYGVDGKDLRVARAGEILDIISTELHEIRAIEDDTIIFNAYLNGIPPGYAELSTEEKNGRFESALKHTLDKNGTLTLLSEYEEIYKNKKVTT